MRSGTAALFIALSLFATTSRSVIAQTDMPNDKLNASRAQAVKLRGQTDPTGVPTSGPMGLPSNSQINLPGATPGSQIDLPRAQKDLPTSGEIKRLIDNQNQPAGPADSQINDQQNPLSTIRPSQPIQSAPSVLTLKGAVEQAITLNHDIARDRYEVARFKWDYIAAQTGRLPNVRAISYLSQQTVSGNPLVPAQANAFVFLSALMPVTQQYRLGLETKALKLTEEIARFKLEQETDDTQAKVKEVYYKLALDQTNVSTMEVTLKYLKELQITTSNRVKEGSALKVDLLKVQATFEKSQLDLLRAQHALQIDREKFNHLLGRDISTISVLEEIPPPDAVELNITNAEQRALEERPEIRAADARRRQINLEKRIRLSQYIPNVSVGVVYITLPGFNNSVLPRNTLAPGIFISYDAFDWGRKAFLAKAQRKSEQAALCNLASVRDEVLIDLHSQINKISEARLAVKTAKFSRDVALEDLRVSMNRYKYTSEKLADVLNAHNALATANDQYEQSLLAFWEAKSEFDRAVGD
jgi:outer membrane protein